MDAKGFRYLEAGVAKGGTRVTRPAPRGRGGRCGALASAGVGIVAGCGSSGAEGEHVVAEDDEGPASRFKAAGIARPRNSKRACKPPASHDGGRQSSKDKNGRVVCRS